VGAVRAPARAVERGEHHPLTPGAPTLGPSPSPRATLAITSAGHALCHGSKIALPSITLSFAAREFGVGPEDIGLALSAYTAGMAATTVPAGLLGDRFGPTRVLSAFFWSLAAAALSMSLAQGFGALVLAHALLGAAAGLLHPAGLGLVSLSVPHARLGQAMGIFGLTGGAGWFGVPLLMQTSLGWRAGFQMLAGVALLGGLVCAGMVRRGLLLAGPSVGLPGSQGTPAVAAPPASPAASAVDAAARPAARPAATHVQAPRGVLLALLFAMGVNAFLLDGFVALFPEAVAALGSRWSDEGLLVSAVMLVGALGQYLGGRLARDGRASARYVLLAGVQAAALLALASLLGHAAWPYLLMAAFAFSNFMTQPIENKLLAVFTSARRRSTAFALKFLVTLLVALPAPMIVSALARTEGADWGFGPLFGLLGGLALLGVGGGLLYLRGARRLRT